MYLWPKKKSRIGASGINRVYEDDRECKLSCEMWKKQAFAKAATVGSSKLQGRYCNYWYQLSVQGLENFEHGTNIVYT